MKLPEGIYTGTIKSWGLSEAKTGTLQVFFRFEVSHEGEVSEWTIFRPITEASAEYTFADLRSLGYPLDTFDELEPDHPKAHSFSGLEIPVELTTEEYQGKSKPRWQFAFGGGGGGKLKAVPKAKVTKLNDLYGPKLRAQAKVAERPKPPPAKANTGLGPNGEPF